MKQAIYYWGLLCLILMSSINLGAQSGPKCKRDFVIKTKVTESTCMANGVIEVILEGDLSEIEVEMTEYALRPVDGTEGTNLQFTKNNILRSVAAGTYVISVRTFCIEELEVGVVTESSNVVVGGNYKPLMAEINLAKTRKSYAACPTGMIAFNVKSGTGFGDLTFHLSKAPDGVAKGEIFPIKGATVSGNTQYSLSELYPIGEYQIDIYDNCSKATVPFSIQEIVGIPAINSGSSYFKRPNSFEASTNKIQRTYLSINSETYPDHYGYYQEKLYEIALVAEDKTPVETDWQLWNSSTMDFTVSGGYDDYYEKKSLKVFARVKGCDATMQVISTAKLNYPYFSTSYLDIVCDQYSFSTTNYQDQDGFWSYPISVKITNSTDGEEVFSQDYDKPPVSVSVDKALYGKRYDILITDSKGITNLKRNSGTYMQQTFSPSLYLYSSPYTYHCDNFSFSLYPLTNGSYTFNCPPVNMVVNKMNTVTGQYEHYLDYTFTSTSWVQFTWEYGQYQLIGTYPNHIKEDGTPHTASRIINVSSPRPTSLTLSSYTSTTSYADLSNEYYGYLQVQGNATFPVGTRFTVTEAPDKYRHKGKTIKSTSSSNYFSFGNSDTGSSSSAIEMPEGNYTITAEDDCGTSLTVTAYLKTGFDAKDVKYVVEENECMGGRIKLDTQTGGFVKLKGVANSSYTNFKIISGPEGGYDTGFKRYNEELQIVADGEYIIGTVISSSYRSYYIRRDTIRFEKSKPMLNPTVTAGYVCTDPGEVLGHIMFTAQGGKSPYSFELLNEDETSTGLTASGAEGERLVFHHGAAGETYIVRITDACGNSTTQEITLADLKTQSIIYSIPPTGVYCTGDEIRLNCITLGQTFYLWEKKISEGVYEFVSYDQNPRLSSATVEDSGIYRVTVTPEYCGEAITGELAITVNPPLVAGAVSADQEICTSAKASAMSCVVTGGKGSYSYQWQMSTDQTTWTDVANGTAATLMPSHSKSGVYYYRLQTTDDCHTVLSSTITLNVKPCYIMVNPNVRSVAD